jgi:hypothetical protein
VYNHSYWWDHACHVSPTNVSSCTQFVRNLIVQESVSSYVLGYIKIVYLNVAHFKEIYVGPWQSKREINPTCLLWATHGIHWASLILRGPLKLQRSGPALKKQLGERAPLRAAKKQRGFFFYWRGISKKVLEGSKIRQIERHILRSTA